MLREIIKNQEVLDDLEKVKTNMINHIKTGDTYLDGSMDYLMASGGKMLRPLLLLTGSYIGTERVQRKEAIINLATAIETLHMATLVHDDIIDQSELRRGKASVQSKYGQSYAVYMGDYLLSQSFLTLTDLDIEKKEATMLARAVQKICIGDMKQNIMRYNQEVHPLDYLRMIAGKTALLLGIALTTGAGYAKAKKEDLRLLGKIGFSMGMAFQLIDDLLDFDGDSQTVGKEVQVDILRGNYTLPVLYTLHSKDYGKTLKQMLGDGVQTSDLKDAYRIINKSGNIGVTKDLAMKYNNRAKVLVEELTDGETKEILRALIPALLDRIK